ncbi:hypothetical protein ONZ43_g1219 [Nemania bipapillata]|uniref:Uncharacterized protein n=1 Tax=Nemania bipapillata TaxID=110536 RepID=A0ACC2J5E2_9PEZI|nr:hypothetical protein ONZ43_g1219 [Nemania bipapillata]
MASAFDIEAGVPQEPLGPPSQSGPQAQPSRNDATNTRRYRHDGIYARILEDRQADGEALTLGDEFYDNYDVEKITAKGFPRIAAFHAKLTTLYQCQLTCLLGALVNLDAEGAKILGEDGSQPALFDMENLKDDGSEEDDQQKKDQIDTMRENLVANIERIFEKYCSRVNWQYELRKFPRASANTHDKIFKHIRDMSGLDPASLDYLRADDDFIYADADPLYERFHTFLIYIRTAIVKSVRFLSCKKIFADEDAPPFGRGTSTLLLAPVGILYLDAPQRPIAFLIVALFDLAFAFTLIGFDSRMLHVLLGLAAYLACMCFI